MNRRGFFLIPAAALAATPDVGLSTSELEDRIRGGLAGQILGDLNELVHGAICTMTTM